MKFPFNQKDNKLFSPQNEQAEEISEELIPQEIEKIPESQIQLGIKESSLEPIYKIKRAVTQLEKRAEVMPFWRNAVTVIALVVSTFSIIINTFVVYFFFSKLPLDVPLFYNHTSNQWQLYDKSFYLGLPILYTILTFITWKLIYSVFPFDRRLASVATWTLLFFSVFSVIGVTQILSLLLL